MPPMRTPSRWLVVLLLGSVAIRQPAAQSSALFAVLGVPEEIAPIERQLANPTTSRIGATMVTSGTLAGRPVIAARSGIGKVNAATAAALVIDHFHPMALLFSGTAG